jgi:large subunit ribosomal protein L32
MPVPKRKTSKSRRDKRQSCKFIRPKAFTACSNCSEPLSTHTLCRLCGFYKGRKVLLTRQDRLLRRRTERALAQKAAAAPEGASEGSESRS